MYILWTYLNACSSCAYVNYVGSLLALNLCAALEWHKLWFVVFNALSPSHFSTMVGIQNVSNNCYFSALMQSVLNFTDIGNMLWDHVKENRNRSEPHKGKIGNILSVHTMRFLYIFKWWSIPHVHTTFDVYIPCPMLNVFIVLCRGSVSHV